MFNICKSNVEYAIFLYNTKIMKIIYIVTVAAAQAAIKEETGK